LRASGLPTLIEDHVAGGASRLAALLLAHRLPASSVVAPCHPGAALRDLVLVQRRQATRRYAIACALTIAALGASVSAHRRDELLQAARIDVGPRRVNLELDLTPGIEVSEAVIAEIDRDRNGSISPDEKREYVQGVLAAVHLSIDGRPLRTELIDATFPEPETFRRGEGTIQLRSAVALPRLYEGQHQLSFRNKYRRDVSVYLANALVPASDRIAVTAQRRDEAQRDLTIDYVVRGDPATWTPVWLLGSIAGFAVLATFLRRPRPL
jgi:hypothetical protein